MKCSEQCYAHISENGEEKETLSSHTELCQKYWIRIFRKKHVDLLIKEFEKEYFDEISGDAKRIFEKMVVNIVTFHDFGKVNPKFQKDKMHHKFCLNLVPDSNIGSKHSILSAIFYLEYFLSEINKLDDKTEKELLKDFAYIYSYIISRHHGKLVNLEAYLNSLTGRNGEGDDLGIRAKEWIECWKREWGEEKNSKLRKSWKNMLGRNGQEKTEKLVYLYGFTRLLYSMLVASDYYATSEYMKGVEIKNFGELEKCEKIIDIYENSFVQKSIRNYQQEHYPKEQLELKQEQDINILRTEMFLDAENELKRNINDSIFYLEAPTGSGKSNTAMNLSFELMKQDKNIQKIFYIYPFNTLVEQNMETISRIFGENKEVMSQVAVVNSLVPLKERADEDDWGGKDKGKKYQTILLDRQFLNYPIVLSTHVMLFRTLFGHYKEDVFGFYQLCNSIIVLDEIQSYKNSRWEEIVTFLKAFAKLLHVKIIIMSATLPNLEILTDNQMKAVHLIKDREKYFHHPKFAKRVVADYGLLDQKMTLEKLEEHICTNITNNQKVLVEFIKKKSAEEFYERMKEQTDYPVLVMTGDSSIQERKRIIEKIQELESVILIATQVIEAGVDIDMDIGYKDISRLDSEEQFMGRINRSAKRRGTVYFFDMDDAGKIYEGDVRGEDRFSLKTTAMREILTTKNFPKFYEENILPAVKESGSGINEENVKYFFRESVQKLKFPEIDNRMKLIEDDRHMISVYLGREVMGEDKEIIDGRKIWEEYKDLLENETIEYSEKIVKLRNLRSKMNEFIYQFSEKTKFQKDEQIGDIYYIENGEKYFDENGVLNRKILENETDLFL